MGTPTLWHSGKEDGPNLARTCDVLMLALDIATWNRETTVLETGVFQV